MSFSKIAFNSQSKLLLHIQYVLFSCPSISHCYWTHQNQAILCTSSLIAADETLTIVISLLQLMPIVIVISMMCKYVHVHVSMYMYMYILTCTCKYDGWIFLGVCIRHHRHERGRLSRVPSNSLPALGSHQNRTGSHSGRKRWSWTAVGQSFLSSRGRKLRPGYSDQADECM